MLSACCVTFTVASVIIKHAVLALSRFLGYLTCPDPLPIPDRETEDVVGGVHGEDSVSQMLHHCCDGETSGISLPGPFPLTQDFFLDGRSWCGAGETRGCQVAERKVKQVESMFLSMSYLFWWLLSLVTESAGCCK